MRILFLPKPGDELTVWQDSFQWPGLSGRCLDVAAGGKHRELGENRVQQSRASVKGGEWTKLDLGYKISSWECAGLFCMVSDFLRFGS